MAAEDAREDDPLVADGPRPVHYRRFEYRGTRIDYGGRSYRFAWETCRREWIAALVGTTVDRLGIPETSTVTWLWESPEAFLARAVAERDGLRRGYWVLARKHLTRRALTPAEARSLSPTVTVEVKDHRDDRTAAIPPLPETAVEPGPPPSPEGPR